MKFTKLTPEESAKLGDALRRNAEADAPLKMDPLTTGWMPGSDELADDEVINAIKSVPCHYFS